MNAKQRSAIKREMIAAGERPAGQSDEALEAWARQHAPEHLLEEPQERANGAAQAREPEPAPAPAPDVSAALTALQAALGGGLTEARVLDLIREHAPQPDGVTRIKVDVAGRDLPKFEGTTHCQFPDLLALIAALSPQDRNAWLTGPAGSGKTKAAEQVAEALGLPFYTTGAMDQKYALTGFLRPDGTLVRTAFREAFEHGGVFLQDEADGSHPGAMLAFNQATANGAFDFPDGMVKRHPDCVIIAAANTYGRGADRQYVGRFQQDSASLDRYAYMDWGYDSALERGIAMAYAGDSESHQRKVGAWVDEVQSVRAAVESAKVRHIVSPRASIKGAQLLVQGVSIAVVREAVLFKGLDADSRAKIKGTL